MAESITHSIKNGNESLIGESTTDAVNRSSGNEQLNSQIATRHSEIIWTPRFIAIIALILAVGLSTASVVTQGWFNGYYSSAPVMMLYTVPILVSWIALHRYARTRWLRWGVIFGYLWTILTALYYRLNYGFIDPHIPTTLHLQVAVYSALTLAYICISLAYTPIKSGDIWFFRLAPIAMAVYFLAQLVLRFVFGRIILGMEAIIFSEILYFDVLVWWARPSCWKKLPGPTLLFGLVPFLEIALTFSPATSEEVKFFFMQVSLIIMLIGILRLLQCERVRVKP
jgi:hypothetical protein